LLLYQPPLLLSGIVRDIRLKDLDLLRGTRDESCGGSRKRIIVGLETECFHPPPQPSRIRSGYLQVAPESNLMMEILELGDGTLYAENRSWRWPSAKRPIRLGIVFEAVDLKEGSFPVIVEARLLPPPEELDSEILDEAAMEGGDSRQGTILQVYRTYGGVPINIDALQPAKASCGFSSFLAEGSIDSEGAPGGEIRHFRDVQEALSFVRDFYAVYSTGLFNFIDEILDNPLRQGGCGRDLILGMVRL